jgi:hypothetical protein
MGNFQVRDQLVHEPSSPLYGMRRRMKWQRRPAYSVIAVVFEHSLTCAE